MNIQIVGEDGKVSESQPTPVVEASNEPFKGGELMLNQIATLFDFKPSEISQNSSKLQTLLDYAKSQSDDHSPENLKWIIRSLGTKLGTPALGENLLAFISRYAHLHLEGMKIEKEKEQFIKKTI